MKLITEATFRRALDSRGVTTSRRQLAKFDRAVAYAEAKVAESARNEAAVNAEFGYAMGTWRLASARDDLRIARHVRQGAETLLAEHESGVRRVLDGGVLVRVMA